VCRNGGSVKLYEIPYCRNQPFIHRVVYRCLVPYGCPSRIPHHIVVIDNHDLLSGPAGHIIIIGPAGERNQVPARENLVQVFHPLRLPCSA